MNAGKLNRRVTIQQKTVVYDELNQPISEDWTDFAMVWADIKFLSGLETVKASADISVSRASIRIRFRDDITSDMRVTFEQSVFDIHSVLPDVAKHEYCDLVCETGANNG